MIVCDNVNKTQLLRYEFQRNKTFSRNGMEEREEEAIYYYLFCTLAFGKNALVVHIEKDVS